MHTGFLERWQDLQLTSLTPPTPMPQGLSVPRPLPAVYPSSASPSRVSHFSPASPVSHPAPVESSLLTAFRPPCPICLPRSPHPQDPCQIDPSAASAEQKHRSAQGHCYPEPLLARLESISLAFHQAALSGEGQGHLRPWWWLKQVWGNGKAVLLSRQPTCQECL